MILTDSMTTSNEDSSASSMTSLRSNSNNGNRSNRSSSRRTQKTDVVVSCNGGGEPSKRRRRSGNSKNSKSKSKPRQQQRHPSSCPTMFMDFVLRFERGNKTPEQQQHHGCCSILKTTATAKQNRKCVTFCTNMFSDEVWSLVREYERFEQEQGVAPEDALNALFWSPDEILETFTAAKSVLDDYCERHDNHDEDENDHDDYEQDRFFLNSLAEAYESLSLQPLKQILSGAPQPQLPPTSVFALRGLERDTFSPIHAEFCRKHKAAIFDAQEMMKEEHRELHDTNKSSEEDDNYHMEQLQSILKEVSQDFSFVSRAVALELAKWDELELLREDTNINNDDDNDNDDHPGGGGGGRPTNIQNL